MAVASKIKSHKKVCHKKEKLKFESYKNCLEVFQLENKISRIEKDRIAKNIKNP